MTILTEAVTASLNSTYTPTDFLNSLFTSLKVSSPTRKTIPAQLTYGTDWDLDDIQTDLISNKSDEEEWVERTDEALTTLDTPFTINAFSETIDDDDNLAQEEPEKEQADTAQDEPEKEQADTEEYVLPADGSEWTRLFCVLRLRLVTNKLSEQERSEGEGLLPYQNFISCLPLTEQVTMFQQLCLLTNTAIDTGD